MIGRRRQTAAPAPPTDKPRTEGKKAVKRGEGSGGRADPDDPTARLRTGAKACSTAGNERDLGKSTGKCRNEGAIPPSVIKLEGRKIPEAGGACQSY